MERRIKRDSAIVDISLHTRGLVHLLQVLEVTTEAMERRVEQDFADAYESSDLYRHALRIGMRFFGFRNLPQQLFIPG